MPGVMLVPPAAALRRRSLAPLALAIALIVAACSSSPAANPSASAAPDPSVTPEIDIGASLKGAAGLVASVYATGLAHVAALTFDADGRVWAATSDSTATGTDAVYLVSGSGVAVKVIDGLSFPLGLLWIKDALLVASASGVERYEGFDGSAFASHRSIVRFEADTGLLGGLALTTDGRVVLGISAPCDHCTPTATYSGSVVSFRPDGTNLHAVATRLRAPVGLAIDPMTGVLYATVNQRDDLGDATPGDWLVAIEDGQDWGFPDCYGQGGSPCATQPAPVAVLDQHAAVSGIAVLAGSEGSASRALVAEWATGKVVAVGLPLRTGGIATVSTFITGFENPAAIAAHGNVLLVGDWGSGTIYAIQL